MVVSLPQTVSPLKCSTLVHSGRSVDSVMHSHESSFLTLSHCESASEILPLTVVTNQQLSWFIFNLNLLLLLLSPNDVFRPNSMLNNIFLWQCIQRFKVFTWWFIVKLRSSISLIRHFRVFIRLVVPYFAKLRFTVIKTILRQLIFTRTVFNCLHRWFDSN